jgi:hypothetical protein
VCPEEIIRQKFTRLRPYLDERSVRLWAATEALALGRGGISLVARATGLMRKTIAAGLRQLQATTPETAPPPGNRVRQPGGGRKPLTQTDPTLVQALEALLEPVTRGDPQSPLRWTCKSTRVLAAALGEQGHPVSHQTVAELLEALDYSLQGNRKIREGTSHPDRDAQFQHISTQVAVFQERGQPTISVDTKKKELVGDFRNAGREWRPAGQPVPVRVHDFVDPELGKAIPYGVYDLAENAGWVSVGTDHDTPVFAVRSVQTWWERMGQVTYPTATELLIMADGGGSNNSRARLWKVELQRLANATGLTITVCHFPPGTSKWNKIEHRMFCHITQNWRGRPLESLETVVQLIGSTTTRTGLQLQAAADRSRYPVGVKVDDAALAAVQLERHDFHGDWNYTIRPGGLPVGYFVS